MLSKVFTVFILLNIVAREIFADYEIDPIFTVLKPKGFEISVTDDKNVENVKFVFEGDGKSYEFQKFLNRWRYQNNEIELKEDKLAPVNGTIIVTHVIPSRCGVPASAEICFTSVTTEKMFSFLNPFKAIPVMPPVVAKQAECNLSISIVSGKGKICKLTNDDLIFEENFDKFDDSKWEYEVRVPLDTEDAEFLTYQNKPENLFVKDGKLHIIPSLSTTDEMSLRTGEFDLNNCTPKVLSNRQDECSRTAGGFTILPPVVSAKIRTKKSFSFTYGRIEIRVKFPQGDWIFPELYLESVDNIYGVDDHASGRIVIAQIRSNLQLESRENIQIGGDTVQGGVIFSNNATLRDKFLKAYIGDDHFGKDFHTYSLTWAPDKISAFVDGLRYANIKGDFRKYAQSQKLEYSDFWDTDHKMAPFNKEFYISLGVGVGGIATFPDDCKTGVEGIPKPWNNTSPKAELNFSKHRNEWYPTWTEPAMQVDYVRVYSL